VSTNNQQQPLYAFVFWTGEDDSRGVSNETFGGIFTSIDLAKSRWSNHLDFYNAASIHLIHPNIDVHKDGILNTPCVAHWGKIPFYIR